MNVLLGQASLLMDLLWFFLKHQHGLFLCLEKIILKGLLALLRSFALQGWLPQELPPTYHSLNKPQLSLARPRATRLSNPSPGS